MATRTTHTDPESFAVPDGRAVVATPARLATPTGLSTEQTRAIIAVLNPIIADAFALYIKTKHYHWHLSGPHFRDYHLLFDEQADQLIESIDPIAERVRKIGGTTIRSVGHVAELTQIVDEDDIDPTADEMITRLLMDNQRLAESQRRGITVCSANGDEPSSNLLQEILDGTERRVWFLYETSQSKR